MMADANELLKPLGGQEITRVSFDWQVRLLTEASWELEILGSATLIEGTSKSQFTGEEARSVSADLIGLRGTRIHAATVDDRTSTLTVAFECGPRLSVPQHEDYESWQVTNRHGLRIICTPGGELALWAEDQT